MALVFERIHSAGIAELSYLVGDDSAGVAAVIDPCADVDCYLELAREKGVSITHIFETHIHADLVIGGIAVEVPLFGMVGLVAGSSNDSFQPLPATNDCCGQRFLRFGECQ